MVKKTKKSSSLIQKVDWKVAVAAIMVIGGLEAFALYNDMDGVLFSLALVAVAGIAGFKLRG